MDGSHQRLQVRREAQRRLRRQRRLRKGCIKGGGSAVFVVGDKVLKLANADKVSEELYGAKVKISGNLEGDTVTIELD
jgi:hypothetical protein